MNWIIELTLNQTRIKYMKDNTFRNVLSTALKKVRLAGTPTDKTRTLLPLCKTFILCNLQF